ncbi:MAG: ECF transporter S component [Caldilineales bacterium]|nr:ECF transporter S component [Caldilineales bacterium]
MTTQSARSSLTLTRVIGALVVATVVLILANLLATSGDEANRAEGVDWILYLVGAVITMAIYFFFAGRPIWQVTTREIVYMAIGAALYGVLSWATNIVQLPSVSLVSLRPAVVLPVFFGFVFGPVVGFFTGAVGNILGDALTGWGVYPVWDIGNGLMGMIPGLILAFANRERVTRNVLYLVAGVLIVFTALALAFPAVEHPWAGQTVGQWWPLLVILLVLVVAGYLLLRRRPSIGASIVWGALGVIVGMGFASIADIWVNGYSVATALLGEFVPAAGANLFMIVILMPILTAAWEAARAQSGR